MPAALAALLALQLTGTPQAQHAPTPPPVERAWDDDAGDLARLGRLAARFDQAVIRRDAALLERIEARVREEIAAELDEARRERRRGTDRRVGTLERARRTFADLKERTDGKSLDKKRTALAEVSQAAWTELVGVAGGHKRWREPREDRYDDRRDDRYDDRRDERYDDHRDGRPDDRADDRRDDRRDERYDERYDERRDEREGWRPPPPRPTVQPMRADQFDALHRAMRQESWVDGRMRVLDAALGASDAWLSVDQLGRLLGLFSFSQEQIALVRRVRPRLADPDRGSALLDRFTFDADKEEVRRILAQP
jgi:uncharacterized protein DUF4476